MDVSKFIFSKDSLKVTSPPPDDIPSIIPNWDLLESGPIPNHIAEPLSIDSANNGVRLGIICYAYNLTLELLNHLRNFIVSGDISSLVITTDTPAKKAQINAFFTSFDVELKFLDVLVVSNIGRDVVPFWLALKTIAPHADVFLKIHWKLSPHLDHQSLQTNGRPASNAWNEDLYSSLVLGDPNDVQQLLSLFKHQKLSCVFPRPWPPMRSLHWHSHSNLLHAANLLQELNCPSIAILAPLIFPAGNMFYGSIEFFLMFLDYFLSINDYPGEPLPADGTLLHAIERIYTLLSSSQGYNVASLFPGKPIGAISSLNHVSMCKRKIIVFPVAELIDSCAPSKPIADNRSSLPILYQSLMIRETQKLVTSNRILRKELKWLRPRNYPHRIKAWLRKKLASSKEALGNRGIARLVSFKAAFGLDWPLKSRIGPSMGSFSSSSGRYLMRNRGVRTHHPHPQPVASNCRRARNIFVRAASTLILQRFLAKPRSRVF